MSINKGKIVGVNGNLLKVAFEEPVVLNEVAYACVSGSDLKLKAEVIRIKGKEITSAFNFKSEPLTQA